VQGYLLKTLKAERFVDLLRRLSRGQPGPSLELAGKLIRTLSGASDTLGPDALTEREQQVLDQMARGVTSNRQLAAKLRISENTVRFHVRNILDKLHLHDRAQAVGHSLRAKAQPGRRDRGWVGKQRRPSPRAGRRSVARDRHR
jgi:DNA-binding NarL/FixJ family response regulator